MHWLFDWENAFQSQNHRKMYEQIFQLASCCRYRDCYLSGRPIMAGLSCKSSRSGYEKTTVDAAALPLVPAVQETIFKYSLWIARNPCPTIDAGKGNAVEHPSSWKAIVSFHGNDACRSCSATVMRAASDYHYRGTGRKCRRYFDLFYYYWPCFAAQPVIPAAYLRLNLE